MKLSKKLASIGLAVAMVASIGATSVFASNNQQEVANYDNEISTIAASYNYSFYLKPGISSWGTGGYKNDYINYANVNVTSSTNTDIPVYYRVTATQSVDTFLGETKSVTGPYSFNLNYYSNQAYPRDAVLRGYTSTSSLYNTYQTGIITF